MKCINVVSGIDYYDDYNYAIDFGQRLVTGTCVMVNTYNMPDVIQRLSKVLINIPNLKFAVCDDIVKVKYYNKCNKRLVDVLKSIITQSNKESNNNAPAYDASDILVVAPYDGNIQLSRVITNNLRVYDGDKIVNFNAAKSVRVMLKDTITTLSTDILTACLDEDNKLRLAYRLDDDYWTLSKIKKEDVQTYSSNIACQVELLSRVQDSFKELENITIEQLKNPDMQTRGFTDVIGYIVDFVKRVFNYLNDNSEAIRQAVVDLRRLILELKELYEKTQTQQQAMYEKTLPVAEQKKLEQERAETKQKLEETKRAIDLIASLSSMCGADVEQNQDMKEVMKMYDTVKGNL